MHARRLVADISGDKGSQEICTYRLVIVFEQKQTLVDIRTMAVGLLAKLHITNKLTWLARDLAEPHRD